MLPVMSLNSRKRSGVHLLGFDHLRLLWLYRLLLRFDAVFRFEGLDDHGQFSDHSVGVGVILHCQISDSLAYVCDLFECKLLL